MAASSPFAPRFFAHATQTTHPVPLVGQKEFPGDFGFSVSHTTRAPRAGEKDGVDYHFTTREAIQPLIAAGKFVESATVHTNVYGTSQAAVESVAAQMKVCILDIDVQGVSQVMKKEEATGFKPLYVFIEPPSLGEVEKRLRGRGTETDDKIRVRLAAAKTEMESSRTLPFDHRVINDDLDECYAKLREILNEQRSKCAACREKFLAAGVVVPGSKPK